MRSRWVCSLVNSHSCMITNSHALSSPLVSAHGSSTLALAWPLILMRSRRLELMLRSSESRSRLITNSHALDPHRLPCTLGDWVELLPRLTLAFRPPLSLVHSQRVYRDIISLNCVKWQCSWRYCFDRWRIKELRHEDFIVGLINDSVR